MIIDGGGRAKGGYRRFPYSVNKSYFEKGEWIGGEKKSLKGVILTAWRKYR